MFLSIVSKPIKIRNKKNKSADNNVQNKTINENQSNKNKNITGTSMENASHQQKKVDQPKSSDKINQDKTKFDPTKTPNSFINNAATINQDQLRKARLDYFLSQNLNDLPPPVIPINDVIEPHYKSPRSPPRAVTPPNKPEAIRGAALKDTKQMQIMKI